MLALAAVLLTSCLYVEPVAAQAMMTEREIRSLFSRARVKYKSNDFEGASVDFFDIIENGTALPKISTRCPPVVCTRSFSDEFGIVFRVFQ